MTEDKHPDYWKKRGQGMENTSREDVDAYRKDHDHSVSTAEVVDFFEHGRYNPASEQPKTIQDIADEYSLDELKDAVTPESQITEDSQYIEFAANSISQYKDLEKLAEEYSTEFEVDIGRQDSHILKTQGYLEEDQHPDLYLRDPDTVPFVDDASGGYRVSERTYLRLGGYKREMLPIRFPDRDEEGRVQLYYSMSKKEVERFRGDEL